jgi:hypothetical protein
VTSRDNERVALPASEEEHGGRPRGGWSVTRSAPRLRNPLRRSRVVPCDAGTGRNPGSGGLIPSLGPGTWIDLRVLDVGGEAVLVAATIGRETPDWAVDDLEAVVDSVELVEGQD